MADVHTPHLPVPLIDLGSEYQDIKAQVLEAVAGVCERTDFILGKDVALFEQEFSAYCGMKEAIGVDSGLSALELILRAYGVTSGHEVIIPANTFIASALAVSATGARPVMVDVDPVTLTIDPDALARAITPRTAAIMPVHLYGHPADMDPINAIATQHGLPVIEDACQAHGAMYKGHRVGSLGSAAAFSFYPAKNLGCYGDGGIAVTNEPTIAQRIRMARNYGQREKYVHEERGYNRRLDTLQAAILRIKLKSLDDRNVLRREHASTYQKLLKNSPLVLPRASTQVAHVWHLFVVRSEHRDGLQQYLMSNGVSTGLHYPVPIHLQQAYRDLGYAPGAFPITERASRELLSLPMYPELQASSIERVAELIHKFYKERR